jgi:hypothetical protein
MTDTPKCGAKTRAADGHACTHGVGQRTEHPGEGKCWLHGGKTPRGMKSPHFKHGRDSRYPTDWVRLDKEQLERVDELAKLPSVDRLDRSIGMQLALQEDAAATGDHRSVGVLGAAIASTERAKIQREQAERLGGIRLRLPRMIFIGIAMTEAELEEKQEELTRDELAAIDVPYRVGRAS